MSIVIILIICLLLLIPASFWFDDVFGMTEFQRGIKERGKIAEARAMAAQRETEARLAATNTRRAWEEDGAFGGPRGLIS